MEQKLCLEDGPLQYKMSKSGMNKSGSLITQLFSIRNRYGVEFSSQKLNLLNELSREPVKSIKALQFYYDTLLFLIAYPDNRTIYNLASQSLHHLDSYIVSHENIKTGLYNSGITNTPICAAFSFEIVKWLRKRYPEISSTFISSISLIFFTDGSTF